MVNCSQHQVADHSRVLYQVNFQDRVLGRSTVINEAQRQHHVVELHLLDQVVVHISIVQELNLQNQMADCSSIVRELHLHLLDQVIVHNSIVQELNL